MERFRNTSYIFGTILAAVGVLFSSGPMFGGDRMGGEFKLSEPVHWVDSILPAGDFAYTVDAEGMTAAVHVHQKGGGFSGTFMPKQFIRGTYTGPSRVIVEKVGTETFVITLRVQEIGAQMQFPISESNASTLTAGMDHLQQARVSSPLDLGFFSIVNPNHEQLPVAEAEKVYLSACETVEREFQRPESIHPRLTLLVGTADNLLRYETREILLKKWDEYMFAEAVVALAINDLGSVEERVKLSKLAVSQASATVNLCDLKRCTN